MSGPGNGHGGTVRDLGTKDKFGIAPSLRDWVMVYQGPIAMIGRMHSDEDDIRREMADGKVPSATLSPVYCLVVQAMMVDMGQGPQPKLLQMINRLESYSGLGREAGRVPLQVILTSFVFLSQLDPKVREHLVRALVNHEQGLSASGAGLVIPG